MIVAGLGEVLWDIYADGSRHLGGAPANAAVHAHRLGARGVVISSVGRDEFGDDILTALKKQGLNAESVQRSASKETGCVRITLNHRGVPSFQCTRDAAFDDLRWNDDLALAARSVDAVITGTLPQRNPVSRETIQRFLDKTSALVVFDVNFRDFSGPVESAVRETLKKTDILKINDGELEQMKPGFGMENAPDDEFMAMLMDVYPLKLLAVTRGDAGCLLLDGEHRADIPGLPVSPVDTTGCGDGFTAGLTLQFLWGKSLEESGHFANRLGAFLATLPGATPKYTLEDFETWKGEGA